MTKSGVEANLKISPYSYKIEYRAKTIEYYFSTARAMNRFVEMLESNRKFISGSLENRFKVKFIIANDFCDLILYRKIESRGFYILIDGRGYEWPGSLYYNGTELCEMKCNDK